MFNNPFTKPGNWYKGAFHIHTTIQDGKLSPKESMKLYQRLGFDFMILSEHEKIVDYASLAPSGLLTIARALYPNRIGRFNGETMLAQPHISRLIS